MRAGCICHHPDRPRVHAVYCPLTTLRTGPRRSVEFLRAPMQDSEAEVVAWLRARGCTGIETHQGPDRSWRGSGRLDTAETMAWAEQAGL